MNRKHKAYLVFSIIFWLLVLMGLLLFSYSLGKVHLNKYGLLRNYYSSWIDSRVYISGLYNIPIGCYFIEFPSSKVYVNDIKLNVTNKDMNAVQITYSFVYRILKDQTYNLYQQLSTTYQESLIASINGVISSYFIDKLQQQTRITLQGGLVTDIQNNYGGKISILKSAIIIQAFWLNQINFFDKQYQYQTAYLQTGALSEAFSTMQIEMMKTNMQVRTMENLIETLKGQIVLKSNMAMQNASQIIESSSDYKKAQQQLTISQRSNASQIFEFYSSPKIILS